MNAPARDVIVVGGGAAGLLAASLLAERGRSVVLTEATDHLGGSTAADTGQFWLPATHLAARLGGPDAPGSALTYLDAVLGRPTPSSSSARRKALVDTADDVVRWLEANRVAPAPVRGRVDFHSGAPQARRGGRVLAAAPFDRRLLRTLSGLLRSSGHELEIAPRSARGLAAAARALASRVLSPTKDIVSGGAALAGRLLQRAGTLGVQLRTSTELVSLLAEEGRVVGVRIVGPEGEVDLRSGAVILACGGFEGNDEWRREHLPLPTDVAWTSGLTSNTGVGIRAATALGAQTSDMGEAWWTPVARFGGRTYRMTSERSLPHGIVVDTAGDRFFDEAEPAPEAGRALYQRNRRVRAVPAYLVVDNRHRQRYRLGPWLPGSAPAADSDVALVRAQSLADLAAQLKIDQAGLLGTVVRFNGQAAKGADGDFGRGASPADRVQGDPLNRKNPCLGTLEKSPYWAIPLYPGDAGTKGGLLIDADSRVVDRGGAPIPGLYAVAGAAATLFKDTAPGPGAALGSALVDAYRAVDHLTRGADSAS